MSEITNLSKIFCWDNRYHPLILSEYIAVLAIHSNRVNLEGKKYSINQERIGDEQERRVDEQPTSKSSLNLSIPYTGIQVYERISQ